MDKAIKKSEKDWWNSNFLKAFLIGLALSFVVFIPFIIIDGGRFLFYGDFNVQQIPFYRLAHDAIRSGNIGWSHLTDLGANFVGSYSFYLLGSPFFWLTIPFPSEWLQFLMGPLLILKFACATLTGYIFIHRYTKTANAAIIGAVLYAFSGFSIYNVFFNHFHEAIVFFPLMLAALDEYMYKRRRGVFALSVFACCFVNYYFFVGQVTFVIIYFVIRILCKSWKISLKDFLLLALEAILGFAMSSALLLPSILTVIQNRRTNNMIMGWDALLYSPTQRYIHILTSMFFPPDLPARPNFTPDSGSKWASIGAWLPMFGMTGVIGWLQIRRKHWLKKLLWACFLIALIPGLNASFQLFNGSYYARWFYMLTLIMALATAMSVEYERVNWKRAVTWNMTIVLAITAVIGFMPTKTITDDVTKYGFGLSQYPTRFWGYVAISILSVALIVFIFQFKKRGSKEFYRTTSLILSLVAVFYSIFFISLGKTQSQETRKHLIPYALNGGVNVGIDDLDKVRSDFYKSLDNSGMFWLIPNIQAFHSIVPGSIMEFYPTIGVTRDVGSRPETKHYALRALTSVKWLFDDDCDDNYFAGVNYDEPAMPGWVNYGNANGFDIWENQYYIPMGFSYDFYITRSNYDKLSTEHRELIMLKAVVIKDDSVDKYSYILSELPSEKKIYTEATYFNDCRERASMVCSDFSYTDTGFNAQINSDQERLVFFSVPYEDGWSAKVNGEAVEIERVNVGFMAVSVPKGEGTNIVFTYVTPGLRTGILISIGSLVLLLIYLFLARNLSLPRRHAAQKNKRKLLNPASFSDYSENIGATFEKQGAMTPKEYALPPLPDSHLNLPENEVLLNEDNNKTKADTESD